MESSGRLYEALGAWRQRRARCDLYHAALQLHTPQGRIAIEQAPVPDNDGGSRGVVASGPVWSRLAGRFRVFRYEVRCWPNGTIPDLDFAVDSPVSVTEDPAVPARILGLLPDVPALAWGRDEAGTGDMWNSNSVVAWVLSRAGFDVGQLEPPPNGRAPGWAAGSIVAARQSAAALSCESSDPVRQSQ